MTYRTKDRDVGQLLDILNNKQVWVPEIVGQIGQNNRTKVIIALNQLHATYLTKIPVNSAEAHHSYILICVEEILYFRTAILVNTRRLPALEKISKYVIERHGNSAYYGPEKQISANLKATAS